MTDRYSIGFALQESDRSSPIEPLADPSIPPFGVPDPCPLIFPDDSTSLPTTEASNLPEATSSSIAARRRWSSIASTGTSQDPNEPTMSQENDNSLSEWTVKMRIKPSLGGLGLASASSETVIDDKSDNLYPKYLKLTAYGDRYDNLVGSESSNRSYVSWLLSGGSDDESESAIIPTDTPVEKPNLLIESRRVSLNNRPPVANALKLTNSTSSIGVGSSFASSTQQALSVNGSQFNLPQIFPSRAIAQLDSLNLWRNLQHASDHSQSLPGGETTLGQLEGTSRISRTQPRASMDEKSYRPEMRVTSGLLNSIDKSTVEGDKVLPSRSKMGLKPLPFGWARKENDTAVQLCDNDCVVAFVSDKTITTHDVAAVRTLDPVPHECGIYYFEVEIVPSADSDDAFSIGFCDDDCTMSKFPGFENRSWGYHGDDGKIVACSGTSYNYGPKYGAGNVIGCGINFHKKTIFYTKDGVYLNDAFLDVTGTNFYPAIGMKTNKVCKGNFGQDEFWFDIGKYVEDYKATLMGDILGSDPDIDRTEFFYPKGTNEMDELVKDIVSSFFCHEGYLEAASAFEQERKQEAHFEESEENKEDEEMADSTMEDVIPNRDDIEIRQQIRALMRRDDIDGIIELLEDHFPQVLAKENLVGFEIRCHKFIDLVRKAKEKSSDDSEAGKHKDSSLLLSEAISYGQQLRKDYKDDSRSVVKSALSKVFSLLAYEDPLNAPEVKQLFSKGGLKPLVQELNSAILASQNKPEVSFLEKLIQQSTQLCWELSDHGSELANDINVRHDFLE